MAMDEAAQWRPHRRGRTSPTQPKIGRPANLAYRRLFNPFEPIRLFSADQVEAIHETALAVLEDTGRRVRHAGAREALGQDPLPPSPAEEKRDREADDTGEDNEGESDDGAEGDLGREREAAEASGREQ